MGNTVISSLSSASFYPTLRLDYDVRTYLTLLLQTAMECVSTGTGQQNDYYGSIIRQEPKAKGSEQGEEAEKATAAAAAAFMIFIIHLSLFTAA